MLILSGKIVEHIEEKSKRCQVLLNFQGGKITYEKVSINFRKSQL